MSLTNEITVLGMAVGIRVRVGTTVADGTGRVAVGERRIADGSGRGEEVAAGNVGEAVATGVTLPAGRMTSFCPSYIVVEPAGRPLSARISSMWTP